MTGNEKLHGGAQRLPARVINDETMSSQRISWYEIASGDQCTRHVHEGKFETWLVIQGTGVSHVGERKFDVGPGDMIATPPGRPKCAGRPSRAGIRSLASTNVRLHQT